MVLLEEEEERLVYLAPLLSPFSLKDALVRTTLGVNWESEGVAADDDDDDDANSFEAVFIL